MKPGLVRARKPSEATSRREKKYVRGERNWRRSRTMSDIKGRPSSPELKEKVVEGYAEEEGLQGKC